MVMHSNLGCSITKDDKFTKKTNLQWDGFLYSEKSEFHCSHDEGGTMTLRHSRRSREGQNIFFLHNCEQSKKNILTLFFLCNFEKLKYSDEKWIMVDNWHTCVQYSCSTTLNISTLKCQLSKWHWVTFINCKAHTSKISSHNLRMRPSGRRGLMISQSIILDFCSFAYWLMLRLLASNH